MEAGFPPEIAPTKKSDKGAEAQSFTLITSLYKIHDALKARGHAGDKTCAYSYRQIREALLVLSKTKLHLKSEDGDDDLIFSPIADFGLYNPDQTDHQAKKAKLYIRFNALITKSVLARQWRQINYTQVIEAQNFLSRWLRKRLGLKFTYAAPNRSFSLKLTTLIRNSGITPYNRLSENETYVRRVLETMGDIIARFEIDKEYGCHPDTGKGRVLMDATIKIRPTKQFVQAQIETNVHQQSLTEAGL